MEVNMYIGCWTLKMKCTQYGLHGQAAFKNPMVRSESGRARSGRLGSGDQGWDRPGSGFFGVAPTRRVQCSSVVLRETPKRRPIDPSSVDYHLGFTYCYRYLHRDLSYLQICPWQLNLCNHILYYFHSRECALGRLDPQWCRIEWWVSHLFCIWCYS